MNSIFVYNPDCVQDTTAYVKLEPLCKDFNTPIMYYENNPDSV